MVCDSGDLLLIDKYNRSTRRFNLNWLQLLLNTSTNTWRSTQTPQKPLHSQWKRSHSTPTQFWVGFLSRAWTRLSCLQIQKKVYMFNLSAHSTSSLLIVLTSSALILRNGQLPDESRKSSQSREPRTLFWATFALEKLDTKEQKLSDWDKAAASN